MSRKKSKQMKLDFKPGKSKKSKGGNLVYVGSKKVGNQKIYEYAYKSVPKTKRRKKKK